MLGFAGYIEPAYVPGVGSEGNDIVVRSTFALDLAKKKPLIGKVAELFKKKYGVDMSENAARSFTAPFVLADAMNRARSTEPEALRKAIAATNIPGNQVIYPWPGITFNPQTGQNDQAKGILVQIQKGQYVTVWPFDSAAAEVVWPLRPWGTKG
jgi:branched-chain amino acid transport system substrate-binding protein